MLNILIAEDNIDLCSLIVSELKRNNYNADFAHDGESALSLLETKHYDMLITDIMMPKVSGFEVVQYARSLYKNMPILIITAKASQEDKYKGFNLGTDDYMVKPIDIDELLLRVGALLRRAKIASEQKLVVGGAVLDYQLNSVTVDGVMSTLPQKEFQILFKLLSYPDSIFTKNQLMEEFWDMNTDSGEMTIYTHIHRLRERYQDCKYFEIVTLRNLGYKAVIK